MSIYLFRVRVRVRACVQNEQRLRKATSDVSNEINKYKKELESSNVLAKIDEVKQAECECCGLKEECTAGYINEVEDCFSGKWVCGLCSEAVKDKMKKLAPNRTAMQEAVISHRDFCQKYNSTRLNPELSLTSAMREIARRSSENRDSKHNLPMSKLGRRKSCGPRIDFKQYM
ncbi:hypothetical protein ACE6H2_004501 [Prunus campanulata]